MTEQKTANIVVFSSDDGSEWDVVSPEVVPQWLKDADAMGYLVRGEILSLGDDGPFYCAENIH